jgi:hypothetical protein
VSAAITARSLQLTAVVVCVAAGRPVGGAGRGSRSRRRCQNGRGAPSSSRASRTSGRSASPPPADHPVSTVPAKDQVNGSARSFGHPQAGSPRLTPRIGRQSTTTSRIARHDAQRRRPRWWRALATNRLCRGSSILTRVIDGSLPLGRSVERWPARRPGRTCAGTPSPTQNRRYAIAFGVPGRHPAHTQDGLYRDRPEECAHGCRVAPPGGCG